MTTWGQWGGFLIGQVILWFAIGLNIWASLRHERAHAELLELSGRVKLALAEDEMRKLEERLEVSASVH